jgi:hypothetical protein
MGRWSIGVITTGECLRLNITNYLQQLKVRQDISGTISWTNGARITVSLSFNDFSATLNLQYTKTDHKGEKHDLNYNVPILSTPSNLG